MKFHLENPAAVPALTKTARIAILSSYKRTNEPALPSGGADARPCFIPLGRRRNKTGAYFFTVGGRTLDQRKPRDAGGVCDLCDLQYSGDDRTFLLYSCGHVFRRAGLRRGGADRSESGAARLQPDARPRPDDGDGGATRYAIAQAGDRTARQNVFSHALCLSALMSAPFLAAGLTAPHPLAALLGADGAVIGMTVEYLRTILLFAPAYFLNNLVLAFLRNDGAPRLAMAAMLSGSIANIFLDYLFIFPLGMGMFGAALATGIAPCIGLAVQSLHFLRGKNGFSLRRTLPDVRQALGILSLGASSFVLELSSGLF